MRASAVALDADPDRFTTSIHETCEVQLADSTSVTLDCPIAGSVDIEFTGVEGLDLRLLPDSVETNVEKVDTQAGSSGLRLSLSSNAEVLLAYSDGHQTAFDESANQTWIAPLRLERSLADCSPYQENDDVECRLAEFEIMSPQGSEIAQQGEIVEAPGGWLLYVATLLDCDLDSGTHPPLLRFGIVHESLLD